MTRYVTIFFAAVASLLPSLSFGFGSGSLFLDDVQGLLGQKPAIAALIATTLDVAEAGTAPMVDRRDNVKLNGVRVAPYKFVCRPKGALGDFTLILVITAQTTFVDATGHKVPLKRASNVKEHLTGICIREFLPEDTGYYKPSNQAMQRTAR